MDERIQDQGPPNPRQAEVDRIRDAAAANLGTGDRQGAARQAARVSTTATDTEGRRGGSEAPSRAD